MYMTEMWNGTINEELLTEYQKVTSGGYPHTNI